MPGPLTGFRIVDLTAVVAGPLATALLADQGADVIKVERPSGDIQRHVGSARGGMSGNFHVLNRGKRSISVDLKQARGREIVERLAAGADALVQNFRPGVTDRLGLGWEALSARNPRLVYVSMSGFGPDGPHARRRAYDPIIQARSGLVSAQGAARGEDPEQINQLLCDKITAYVASQATTAALLARERTGSGQHVTVSMLDSAIAFLWPDGGADSILLGDGVDHRPPIGAAGYLTAFRDGWATTMALSDAEFEGLCGALDMSDVARDPRFASIGERQRHRDELRADPRHPGSRARPRALARRGRGAVRGGPRPVRTGQPGRGPARRPPGGGQRDLRRERPPDRRAPARGQAGPTVQRHAGTGRRAGAADRRAHPPDPGRDRPRRRDRGPARRRCRHRTGIARPLGLAVGTGAACSRCDVGMAGEPIGVNRGVSCGTLLARARTARERAR